MRKILIGTLVACMSLLGLAGMAAADFSWSGWVDFGITGTSDGASGVFADSAGIDVEATATSGPWSGTVAFEDFALDDGFITYGADAFDLTMNPVGIDSDLGEITCAPAEADSIVLGIPSHAGLQLDLPAGGIDFFAIVNNVGAGDDVTFNYAGGINYTLDALGLGLVYNSDQEAETTSYKGEVSYGIDDLSLLLQYGSFSPDSGDAGAGYYFEAAYTLSEGTTATVSYIGADDSLNSADGVARDAFSEIYGEVVTALADSVNLTIDVTSTDDGSGADSVTAWEALIGFSI
ncbi:hypothetical protein KAS10_03470 [Candidatus Aerophobetes bacterium]|nr:hypothetical protein [Candidatus Aerophobetes bacterium]